MGFFDRCSHGGGGGGAPPYLGNYTGYIHETWPGGIPAYI